MIYHTIPSHVCGLSVPITMQNFMSYHVYMLKSECEFNVMLGYDVMLILCVTVCVIGSC
jgi:hypothetical protein